jgi:hypothetical protein
LEWGLPQILDIGLDPKAVVVVAGVGEGQSRQVEKGAQSLDGGRLEEQGFERADTLRARDVEGVSLR